MLYQQVLADLFEAEIITVYDADEIDETQESPALLAREAATPLLEQHDDVPLFVFETDHGFLVGGGSHGILMIPDGSVDVREIPEPDDEEVFPDDDDVEEGHGGTHQGRTMSAGEKSALMSIVKKHGLYGAMKAMREAAEELGDDLPEEYEYTLEMVQEHILGYVDEHYEGEMNQELLNLLRAFDEAKDEEDYDRAIAAMEAVAEFVGTPLAEAGYMGSAPMPKKPMDTGPGYEGKTVSAGPKGDAPASKKYGTGNQGGQMKLNQFMGGLYGKKNSPDGKEAGPAPKKPKDVGGAYAAFESAEDTDDVDDAYGGPYDGPQQPNLAHPKNKKKKNKKGGMYAEGEEPAMFEFTFPASRVKEFLALAGKAGAEGDGQVTVDGDSISVVVPEAVAKQVRVQFAGDDVTVEQVETAAAAD